MRRLRIEARRMAMDVVEFATIFVACCAGLTLMILESIRDWLDERERREMRDDAEQLRIRNQPE